ncbi:DUF6711 family protein [Enterococcus sp. AZ109]|uniref:DUF6711 family protein n=1 Tax=Enterococcus sp. AZ109 TaxID=2774634 RepID=UPI003F1FD144
MSYLQINGVTVTTPKSFQWSLMDVDGESSRTANGDMNRDKITEKVKLEIEWGPLSSGEISRIIEPTTQVFFQCTYPDAKSGGMQTRTFYPGDRTAPAFSWNKEFSRYEWNGLKVNFIEK